MGGLGRVQRLRSPVGGGRYGTPLIIIVSRAGVDEAGARLSGTASLLRGFSYVVAGGTGILPCGSICVRLRLHLSQLVLPLVKIPAVRDL